MGENKKISSRISGAWFQRIMVYDNGVTPPASGSAAYAIISIVIDIAVRRLFEFQGCQDGQVREARMPSSES